MRRQLQEKPSEKSEQAPLILLPAAGFGRRVGSPPAKEMLLRYDTKKPLIEWSLDLARKRQWPVLVITRHEKKTLIEYLKKRQEEQVLNVHLIPETSDWQETILESSNHWRKKNLLILPDCNFQPTAALDLLNDKLDKIPIVLGVHRVSDPSNWGVIKADTNEQNKLLLCEKPIHTFSGSTLLENWAWGLMGFRASIGTDLMKASLKSQKVKEFTRVPGLVELVELDFFEDLTRGST